MAAQREQLIAAAHGLLSHMVAPLVTQMGLDKNTNEPVHLLDNACGSGVLTQEVHKALKRDVLESSLFLCADVTPSMVDVVKWRVENEGWVNTEVKNLNAMARESPDISYPLVLMIVYRTQICRPHPSRILAYQWASISSQTRTLSSLVSCHQSPAMSHVSLFPDSKRTLQRGGILGLSTPDQDGVFWEPDVRSAFASFPFAAPIPEALPKQMHEQGKWTDRGWIQQHLENEGFSEVKVTIGRGTHHVESANDFVATFGPTIAWFLSKWWDDETRAAHPTEEVMELVKKHLDEKYEGKGWDMEWSLIYATGIWEGSSK